MNVDTTEVNITNFELLTYLKLNDECFDIVLDQKSWFSEKFKNLFKQRSK